MVCPMRRPALECDINYSPPVALSVADANSAERNLQTMMHVTRVVQNIDSFERELSR